jgi:hypothetical protein
MAYDENLADRIRELIAGQADLTEQKMFGGLAFLIGGNMAVAASGQGGVLVRVDPAESSAIVATTSARPMEMAVGRCRMPESARETSAPNATSPSGWSSARPYARSLPAKR